MGFGGNVCRVKIRNALIDWKGKLLHLKAKNGYYEIELNFF